MKRDWLWQRVPRITTIVFVTVMLLPGAMVVNAAEEKLDDKWHFTITPYIWLPSTSGSMELEQPPGFGSGNMDTGPGNYLEYLKFIGMIDFQVQKGRWSFLADIMYVDFAGDQTAHFPGVLPGGSGWTVGADWELQALLFELAGAYSVFRNEYVNFDLLAGVSTRVLTGRQS